MISEPWCTFENLRSLNSFLLINDLKPESLVVVVVVEVVTPSISTLTETFTSTFSENKEPSPF